MVNIGRLGKLVGFFLGVVFLCVKGYAEEIGAEDVFALFSESTIVTASKREQKLIESPSAISVITAEDIKQLGATQIPEAFTAPGIHFGYTHHAWMNAGGIRGFHKLPINKVQFLIDGVSWVFDLYEVPFSSLLPIALDEIDRVEILRGPGSSLYGTNAMFGVVNIITKKTKNTHGNMLSVRAGELNTIVSDYIHGGSIEDKIHYRISIGGSQRDTWDFIAHAQEPIDEFSRTNVTIDYSIDDNSNLNILGGFIDSHDFFPLFNTSGPVDFSDSEYFNTGITYTSQVPNVTLRYYWRLEDMWKFGLSRGVRTVGFKNGRQSWEFQHSLEPLENDILTWGGNFIQIFAKGDSTNRRRHDLRGVFVDNTYKMNDYFHLNTALRYDHHPNTNDTIAHRLVLLYFPTEKDVWRFSWASSFRNPDFAESYIFFLSGGVFPVIGAQDLRAEKAETLEVGHISELTNKLSLETNVFFTKVQDFIDLVNLGTRAQFLNRENANQYGTEIEAKYQISKWLSGILNYTFYEQWEEDIADRLLVTTTPEHIVNAQLRAKFDNGFSSNLSLKYSGSTEWNQNTWTGDSRGISIGGGKAKDYLIANLRVGYSFKLLNNEAEIGVAAFNLLDKKFDDYPISTHDIGRRVTGSFTYKF